MYRLFLIALFCVGFNRVFGQNHLNVTYAQAGNRALLLDIYSPTNKVANAPLIIWIHGGAWHGGSKENPPKQLLEKGYFLASIDYRLSTEAPFPAMVHDIKAAVRYLRANAAQYGYHPAKLALWGSSAGGHLAALAALSSGDYYLEGNLGNNNNTSSTVQALVDFYGPSNFNTILNQSTAHGVNVRRPALALFFGKPIDNLQAEFSKASPISYVDAHDPPTFIAHGNQDNQVPINQSLELWAALQHKNVDCQMEILQETGHGGGKFDESAVYEKLLLFLQKVFR